MRIEQYKKNDSPEFPPDADDDFNKRNLITFLTESRMLRDKSVFELPVGKPRHIESHLSIPFDGDIGADMYFNVTLNMHVLDGTLAANHKQYTAHPFGIEVLDLYKEEFNCMFMPFSKEVKNVDGLLFRRYVIDPAADLLSKDGKIIITFPGTGLIEPMLKAASSRFEFSLSREGRKGGLHAFQIFGTKKSKKINC